MDDILRIASTAGHGIAYYPDYLALELGFFKQQGLRVKTYSPGQGPFVARALETGQGHIGLGGMWRPLLARGRSQLMCFAQLVDCYSSVLLSRQPVERFSYEQLIDKVVMIPGGNPSAWILFQHLTRQAGVDLDSIHFLQTFAAAEATDYFRDGIADYYLAGEPTSDLLIDEGVSHFAMSEADGGQMPASVYYATPEFLGREDNAAGRFVVAIEQALNWLAEHDPTDAAQVFTSHFPSLKPEVVATSVRSCKAAGVWSRTARITESGLLRWQEILAVDKTVMREILPYSEIVDSRAADWAEQAVKVRA